MIAAIVQARMGSSRLPGKVLADVGGRPLLAWMLERVSRAGTLDAVVVATTTDPRDDPVADWCRDHDVPCHRGSEQDVLDRYHQVAGSLGATTVVRLTADCPLIDPAVIDDVVRLFQREGLDYAANTAPPEGSTYPDGMDVEVFSAAALERAWSEAVLPSEREHVTFHFWKNPDRFATGRLDLPEDLSHLRLTVDYPEDLELVRAVLAALYPRDPAFTMTDVADFLREHPGLTRANAHVARNAGWRPALEADADATRTDSGATP